MTGELCANTDTDSFKLLGMLTSYNTSKTTAFLAHRCPHNGSNHDLPVLAETAPLIETPCCRAERGDGEGSSGGDEAETRSKEDASLPDPNTFLEGFPRCKRLVDTFRANPNTHNKTPLAILHEYATRLSLEVSNRNATWEREGKDKSQIGP